MIEAIIPDSRALEPALRFTKVWATIAHPPIPPKNRC